MFQVVPKATAIGAAQVTQAIDIGKKTGHPVKRIAILFEDTAYGSSQADGLAAKAKEMGLEVPLKEGYPAGITDVTSIVQKLRMAERGHCHARFIFHGRGPDHSVHAASRTYNAGVRRSGRVRDTRVQRSSRRSC